MDLFKDPYILILFYKKKKEDRGEVSIVHIRCHLFLTFSGPKLLSFICVIFISCHLTGYLLLAVKLTRNLLFHSGLRLSVKNGP